MQALLIDINVPKKLLFKNSIKIYTKIVFKVH